jgi:ferritin-like metal-binding protein YciE
VNRSRKGRFPTGSGRLRSFIGGVGNWDDHPTLLRRDHDDVLSTSPSPRRDWTMAKEKTLEDLFLDTLKDIYYAERKILKALPKMKRAAQAEDLKAAFEKHHQETEVQIERLQQVFELLGKRAQGKTCDAIEGIIAEGEEIMDEFKDTAALDAGLISAAQAVEHYEMTRYGTLKRWATELGMADAAKLLDATLKEESKTDADLTKLADSSANDRAKARKAA